MNQTMKRSEYRDLLERTLLQLADVPGEFAEAEIGLLSAILEYEEADVTYVRTLRAVASGELPVEEGRKAPEALNAAGAKLKEALKRVNTLEGKRPYTQREVLGVKWMMSKGDLPYRL